MAAASIERSYSAISALKGSACHQMSPARIAASIALRLVALGQCSPGTPGGQSKKMLTSHEWHIHRSRSGPPRARSWAPMAAARGK